MLLKHIQNWMDLFYMAVCCICCLGNQKIRQKEQVKLILRNCRNLNVSFFSESMSYKDKKAAKLKAQSNASRNWNSLFVGQNAVVEVMAKTYGTTKDNILDPFGDSDVAVRLALGETQIVLETKKYLEEHGVILDAFSGVSFLIAY